ncbi:MAG: hypothetical protein NTV50_07000 [Planctomycetota bacterium]|nr:hypothetical protein [Planctomycetota bacterium]
MNIVKRAKLDFMILAQSVAIIFLITTEITADTIKPKNPAPTQPNPKTSAVTPNKQRPPISEGSKPSNPNPPKDKANNPPVSIPEVVKPSPTPVPAKPANPPASIPEVVKPKPITLPAKPSNPPIFTPEVVKPKPIPLPKKPNDPPVSIPEVVKPTPVPAKPSNPPVSTPEVVKPKPIPLPKKPNDPPVSIPEVVKPTPTPVPLRRPIVSDKKPLPTTGATKAPIQEPPPRYTTFVDSNNRRNMPINQTNYHQQTVRDFYEHTRKYPQPISRNQGNTNNFNTYSWVNNNRYFYGYNYRNYNYITCYDRFNNRFSFITVPNENLTYPVVIQPYPPVMIQPYPVNYYQAFDTTGFLSPILMLLRITQGNYIW